VYDQFHQAGLYRHIVIRRAFFTDQIMIIFSVNHEFQVDGKNIDLTFIKNFFAELTKKYPIIKSVYLSLNSGKADIAI